MEESVCAAESPDVVATVFAGEVLCYVSLLMMRAGQLRYI
jgi:hypothetical protein